MALIPCQCCGKSLPDTWDWVVCDTCGYRICSSCIGRHHGRYGFGLKCSQCPTGHLQRR